MGRKIGIVPFWKNYERKSVIRAAQLAEDLGYDSIWVPEAWAYEQFQLLTEIAVHTRRIKLATGIVNIFSRNLRGPSHPGTWHQRQEGGREFSRRTLRKAADTAA